MPDDVSPDRKSGKEVLDATRPYATESPLRSWASVISTLIILIAALTAAAITPWWPARLAISLLGALVFVRAFILYHDFMHHSLLRKSRLAKPLFHAFGMLLLTPPGYWRYSHNYHHGNVCKPVDPKTGEELLVASDVGSFPLMSIDTWKTATFWQRFHYRLSRHPLTLLLAYFTVFLFSLTLFPLLKNPQRYWDGAVALGLHASLITALWYFFGFSVLIFAFLLPFMLSASIGAYLFYAQHNYEGLHVLEPHEWTYYRGSLESSSFMKIGPVMDWFTGNIGYHHVHHLNPLIPFYRLPETMAAIPDLQMAKTTSLRPRDIISCLRLNLWDDEHGKLVTYGAARRKLKLQLNLPACCDAV